MPIQVTASDVGYMSSIGYKIIPGKTSVSGTVMMEYDPALYNPANVPPPTMEGVHRPDTTPTPSPSIPSSQATPTGQSDQYYWKDMGGTARIVDASGNPVDSQKETEILKGVNFDIQKITKFGGSTSSSSQPASSQGVSGLNTYQYVKKDGTMGTIQASSSNEAINKAIDRDPSSGVQLISSASPAGENTQDNKQIMDNIQSLLDGDQIGSKSAITGETTPIPTPPSAVESYEEYKTKYGVDPLENEIADIDVQIANLTALTEGAVAKEGERLTSMGIIRRRQESITTEQKIELNRLNNIKIAKQQQLDSKYKAIELVMGLKQQDYSNALKTYELQYDQAVKAQSLMNQERDDNRAVLTTVMNSFKGLSWDSISSDMKLSINKLEMLSGLPVGTTQAFLSQVPEADVKGQVSGYDANGNQIVSFWGTDASGNPKVWQGVPTGAYKDESESGTNKVLTSTQYSRLEALGVDKNTADAITASILYGKSLEEIRQDMRNTGIDPVVLDYFDRIVGIADLLGQKKSSSGLDFNDF